MALVRRLSDMTSYRSIPYGVSDFPGLRRRNKVYVDKTRFLRRLEDRDYCFFIRPRRFGKSLWTSVLTYYYDRAEAGNFDELFGGTDIGADPTPSRSRYVVLHFDFSAFKQKPETLEECFERYCAMCVRSAVSENPDLFPDDAVRDILSPPEIDGKLNHLFDHARTQRIPVCYYFGLLGIEGAEADFSLLGIPNETVRRLLCGWVARGESLPNEQPKPHDGSTD